MTTEQPGQPDRPGPEGSPQQPEQQGEPGEPGQTDPPPRGGPSGRGPSDRDLSDRDLAVLDLAARTFSGPGPRERAVRERLGMSPTAYFQLLNALLDDPRALRHDPVTVNRLRRDRERRRAER